MQRVDLLEYASVGKNYSECMYINTCVGTLRTFELN